MGELDEASPKCIIDSDKRDKYAMVFDAPNPEDMGKEDGIEV